jgi:hypothetical protein
MKLVLGHPPLPGDVHAVAGVTLAAGVLGRRALPARAPSPDNPLAAGRRTSPGNVAAYLAVTALGCSQAAVARALGRRSPSVWEALRGVEMRRDEPLFDAALEAAEQEIIPA